VVGVGEDEGQFRLQYDVREREDARHQVQVRVERSGIAAVVGSTDADVGDCIPIARPIRPDLRHEPLQQA
jgi:hypothetical protein